MPVRKDDEKYDRAVESFPASDPPANSGIVGPRATRPARRRTSCERDNDSGSKGTPTNEHDATETAHQEQRERQPSK